MLDRKDQLHFVENITGCLLKTKAFPNIVTKKCFNQPKLPLLRTIWYVMVVRNVLFFLFWCRIVTVTVFVSRAKRSTIKRPGAQRKRYPCLSSMEQCSSSWSKWCYTKLHSHLQDDTRWQSTNQGRECSRIWSNTERSEWIHQLQHHSVCLYCKGRWKN